MSLQLRLDSFEDTTRFGCALAFHLAPGDLVILKGDLGAGKTFLAGTILHGLGLDEEERVPSPTYSLVLEYPTNPPVAHADLYRLREANEVYDLGLDEMRERGFALLVEWGTPYEAALGGDALRIDIELDPRRATVSASGERSKHLIHLLTTTLARDEL